jgi:hypothetical protein
MEMKRNYPLLKSHYARLSPSNTPAPCSQEDWRTWIDRPYHTPCLARERIDAYAVELDFTGSWTGPAGERPRFFTLSVRHPHASLEEWTFEAYDAAREAFGGVPELVREGSEAEVEAYV